MKNEEMALNTADEFQFAERTFTAKDMNEMLAEQGWVAA